MAQTVDELTVTWEEEGKVVVKELDKHVLSKGAWATIMFLYQELDKESGEYKPPKVTIRRYRKKNNQYMFQSKFNISSENQGLEIAKTIEKWYQKA